jgi:hypothetical protein
METPPRKSNVAYKDVTTLAKTAISIFKRGGGE